MHMEHHTKHIQKQDVCESLVPAKHLETGMPTQKTFNSVGFDKLVLSKHIFHSFDLLGSKVNLWSRITVVSIGR